ncbi:MAG: hypothetical protein GXO28_01750 [Methanopyri archaeon]|nr:hypothetical protein [Methanopyri archaeon]
MALIDAAMAGLAAGIVLEMAMPAMIRRSITLRTTVVAGAISTVLCALSPVWPSLRTIGAAVAVITGLLAVAVRMGELKSGQFGAAGFSVRNAPAYVLLVALGIYALA